MVAAYLYIVIIRQMLFVQAYGLLFRINRYINVSYDCSGKRRLD